MKPIKMALSLQQCSRCDLLFGCCCFSYSNCPQRMNASFFRVLVHRVKRNWNHPRRAAGKRGERKRLLPSRFPRLSAAKERHPKRSTSAGCALASAAFAISRSARVARGKRPGRRQPKRASKPTSDNRYGATICYNFAIKRKARGLCTGSGKRGRRRAFGKTTTTSQ